MFTWTCIRSKTKTLKEEYLHRHKQDNDRNHKRVPNNNINNPNYKHGR